MYCSNQRSRPVFNKTFTLFSVQVLEHGHDHPEAGEPERRQCATPPGGFLPAGVGSRGYTEPTAYKHDLYPFKPSKMEEQTYTDLEAVESLLFLSQHEMKWSSRDSATSPAIELPPSPPASQGGVSPSYPIESDAEEHCETLLLARKGMNSDLAKVSYGHFSSLILLCI